MSKIKVKLDETMSQKTILPEVGIFSHLDEDKRGILADYGEFFGAPSGARVVEQDYFQDSLYFVLSGQMKVFYSSGDVRNHIATIESGETVGEANLFSPGGASASVYISEDSQLWRIDKEQMSRFIIAFPSEGLSVVAEIIALLSRRIRTLNEKASTAMDVRSTLHEPT